MLTSITPLGERGRRQRWGLTTATYVIGSTAGGAAVGLALGALGAAASPSSTTALGALGVLALGGIALDLRVGGLRVPSARRQVDETWLTTYRGWVYGTGFGFQLGLGVVTIVTTASLYVALGAALLGGSVVGGLAVGTAFGAARALPVLLARGVHEPGALRTLMRRVQHGGESARRAALAGQAATAAFAAVALARGGA
jgi:hypothetical protein